MGFYGEIVNTGESPFVFDKIYTSRYHMEKSMAADGIYAGRFVLISYDSSYSHNDFKRVYIKDEDRGPNKTNINLYKDSDCTQVVKYKDFDTEIEAAGEELASTLAEIYYVTDGSSYTYYKCSGNGNGVALFDYYLDMNLLFNQAYRQASETNEDVTIRLFKDSECTEPIEMKNAQSTEGVIIGDVVFVEERAAEASAKEQAQGIFSFYECTMQEEDIALFKKINTTTGHYQDESLENYIFNQKLDSLYYGNEGGVHNYDKTVWQKVYIGEKEKYIKVASLNSSFPKINLSIDPPETTMTHAPYFDTDVNGQVEDLHIQPQWGLRVAAANKALSTKGSWINPISGNYISYVEGIKNAFRTHARSLLTARFARETQCLKDTVDENNEPIVGNAYSQLISDLNNLLNGDSWSGLENINSIQTSLIDYLSLSEENLFTEAYNFYNTATTGIVGPLQDSNENQYLEVEIIDFYNNTQLEEEDVYKEVNIDDFSEITSPVEEGWYEFNGLDYILTSDTEIEENVVYYYQINEIPLYEEIKNIVQENASNTDLIAVEQNIDLLLAPFDDYFGSLIAYNTIYNNNLAIFFWNTYGQIDNILKTIFSVENADYDVDLEDIVLFLEDYEILTSETIEDAIEANYNLIEDIFEDEDAVKSDEEIRWSAKTSNGEVYNFDGSEWVTDSVTFPADIYYNKAGFDYTTTSKDENINDEILVTPTGLTQIYDEANDIWVNREFSNPNSDYINATIEAPDVQELSIHLPSIGNTISDVWDIVYGKGEEENNYQRKTNITWDNSVDNRTRLIGNTTEGGYTYSSDSMATVAGVINTAQDLIGRIIIEDVNGYTSIDDEDLSSTYIQTHLNNDNIYYLSEDQKYYRVNERYDFDLDNYNPPFDSSLYITSKEDYESKVQGYSEVELIDPKNLSQECYYFDPVTQSYNYSKNYLKNKSYFTFDSQEIQFEVEGFYTKPGTDKTLYESENQAEGTYYNFNVADDIVTGKYLFVPGEFYTYDSEENIYVAAQKFNPFKNYYLPYTRNVISVDEATQETIYGTVKFVSIYSGVNFDSTNPIKSIIVRTEEELDLEALEEAGLDKDDFIFECYIKHDELNKVPNYFRGAISYISEENNDEIKYHWVNKTIQSGVSYNIKPQTTGEVEIDGVPIEQQDGDNIFCGILKSKLDSDNYEPERSYAPDTYYYSTPSGYSGVLNFTLDTSAKYDVNKTYYTLSNIHRIYLNVYEKNRYYQKSKYIVTLTAETYEAGKYLVLDSSTNTYIISNDPFNEQETYYSEGYLISVGEFDPNGEKYYEHNKYYVTQDYLSHTVGEIWDSAIPWEDGEENYSTLITECKLVSEYDLKQIFELKELIGFGRQYNTVNGLILKLNQLLGDEYSADRNLDTIYGALRRLNDEVSRLSLYKSSVVEDITTAIIGSYTIAIEIVDQIKALRAEATGTAGGLLTEGEATHYYASTKDLETIVGYHFDNETCRIKQDILYPFTENMDIGDGINQYQFYNTVGGVDFYRLIIEVNGENFTYQQDYINSNIEDSVYPGVKTIADLQLPQLFNNSSSTTPRSIIDEIDHKVNLESYITDIGRVPMGMKEDPTTAAESEEIKIRTGSILDRLYKIEENLDDIETVLYGNGLGTSTFNLTGCWVLDDNPISTITLDQDLNFYHEGNPELFHHITVTDSTVTYISKNEEGTVDAIVPVFVNGQWLGEKYRQITILESESTNEEQIVDASEEEGEEQDSSVTPEDANNNSPYPTNVTSQDSLYLWLKENAKHHLITYNQIALLEQDYQPNKYYILSGEEYILATGDFNPNTVYYTSEWEEDPDGIPTIPGTNVFNPKSSITNILKQLNGNGLLARLTALDTSIETITSVLGGYDISEEESQSIRTSLVDIKSQAQKEITGSSTIDPSQSGIIVPKGISLLDVDAKYGFSLLKVQTSSYKYDAGTGETTWDYNIRVAFKPTAALSKFNEAFLKVDGLQLYEGAQYLTIKSDADTTPNLDAQIGLDGTIYLSNNGTWPAVSGANAYTFLLAGHLVEKVEKDSVAKSYTISFIPDSSVVQKNSSFKTQVDVKYNVNNPMIRFPANPTLKNCTFVGWMSGDGKLLITPEDLGGGLDITPEHPKWGDMFHGKEKDYLYKHYTYYPVFKWNVTDSALIRINGTDYWTTAKTQTLYNFIKNQKAQSKLKIVATKNYQFFTSKGYTSVSKKKTYLAKKAKYFYAKKKIAKETTKSKNLRNMSTWTVLKDYAGGKVTQSGKFSGYQLTYLSLGAPAKTSSLKKKTQVTVII